MMDSTPPYNYGSPAPGSYSAPEGPSSSTWYLNHLDAHIGSSYRHVLGQPSSATYHTPAGQFVSQPTIVPPTNSIWTPDEKSRFFAALSRHSRFRTDAIALDVGSKTEAEVKWYIALLDSGSEARRRADGETSGFRDRRARWDGSLTWREGLAPAARQVSEEWVAKEDLLAAELIASLRERDDGMDEQVKKKRRRMERSQVNATIHINPDLKPYEKRRLLESGPHLAHLEKRWAIEDWGQVLDAEKLQQLDTLLHPEWAEWYARRVRDSSPPQVKREASGSSDTEREGEARPAKSSASTKGDKNEKIARDRREYAELSAIPKKDRTPDQRKRLTVILNRKRNREEYRTKKLLAGGMTIEEIEKAGGADAVYAKREEQSHGSNRDNGDASDASSTERLGNAGTGAVAGKHKESSPVKIEEDVTNAVLKQKGVYDHVLAHGLEVFNYNGLSKMIRQTTEVDVDVDPPNPTLSFELLHLLHAELVFYLRHLFYRAMIIAEQAYAQSPTPTHTATPIGEDDCSVEDGPEMTVEHVRQALALGGLGYYCDQPNEEEAGDHASQDEKSTVDTGPAEARRERYSETFLPPNHLPWDMLPSLAASQAQSDAATTGSAETQQASTVTEDGGDNDETMEEPESRDEAREYKKLDQALDAVDEDHDKIYEEALWDAEADGEDVNLEQLGASWVVRSTQWIGESRSSKRQSERSESFLQCTTDLVGHSREGSGTDEMWCSADYLKLLLSTSEARRRRLRTETRLHRFPTTRLKSMAKAKGSKKSHAIVIDSDIDIDEDEDEDEDEQEEGEEEGAGLVEDESLNEADGEGGDDQASEKEDGAGMASGVSDEEEAVDSDAAE